MSYTHQVVSRRYDNVNVCLTIRYIKEMFHNCTIEANDRNSMNEFSNIFQKRTNNKYIEKCINETIP